MSEPLSPKNSTVVQLRALTRQRRARREAGRFVVEGLKLVQEVLGSTLTVVRVYADAEWELPGDLEAAVDTQDVELVWLGPGGIERVASTSTPQPILAEVVLPVADWSVLIEATAALVAVDLNDPGNLGTLARSAEAAGFDALIALGETTDPFGPKAIRASAGALFRQTVVVDADVAAGLDRLAELGLERVGTRMIEAEACDTTDLSGPIALVVGSEAHGLSDLAAEHIDRWVRIPMGGSTESLNAAMAGTILTYEIGRQRRGLAS